MSAGQIAPADHVCYVHCNFCNTVLAVSVPGNSMLSVVTVRCGHCTNLLSVNLRGLMHSPAPAPLHDHLQDNLSKAAQSINNDGAGFRDHNQSSSSQQQQQQQHSSDQQLGSSSSSSSSSRFRMPTVMFSPQTDVLHHHHHQQTPHARPPEKRQRVPSAYNRFIKEEIRRIKANNPDISHREAFSTAAKNWAHFPNIHFGLNPGGRECGNKLADIDTTAATTAVMPAPNKIQGFCS